MLTDEWCEFFRENNFLVGVSIDGPQEFHDEYRRTATGKPTFHKVMQGIRLLNKHNVEWNALAVVNDFNADYPLEFYNFFKEIDMSIKRNCKNLNSVQPYFFAFQGFSQELMMVMGNLMKWKFRVPGFMKNALRTMTQKTVNDVLTKDNWKKDDVRKACMSVRQYQQKLGYSGEWMAEYVYNIVVLAKKEPKPKDVEDKDAKK